jgi:hypothetical protein
MPFKSMRAKIVKKKFAQLISFLTRVFCQMVKVGNVGWREFSGVTGTRCAKVDQHFGHYLSHR